MTTQQRAVETLVKRAVEKYQTWYGGQYSVGAYAPGRVEVLGNHTDYNEGFVLSAAIDFGTVFLASCNGTDTCRLVAGDLMEERSFPLHDPTPFSDHSWPNYVMGVAAGLVERSTLTSGFDALFFGNVPIGSGLSSSAALEISAGLALASLSGSSVDTVEMARIGQRAEHEYVGAKTGLLDQISSLSGAENHLVHTDFRSLEIKTVPFDESLVLLTLDTRTKHSLGESDYNERRQACEAATAFFSKRLDRPVTALRDVTPEELEGHRSEMEEIVARRAAHVIGENRRVTEGTRALARGNMARFGELMYQSHESSRYNFENSCDELDFLVDRAGGTGHVLGARLSGGGFGGSVVLLLAPEDVDRVISALEAPYRERFGDDFVPHTIHVSEGARLIE